MKTAVDFFILAGDSGTEFLTNYDEVKQDITKTNAVFGETHSFLGMRLLGPSKVAWSARRHGYTSQVLQKCQLLTVGEIIAISEKFVDVNTIIGISTTFLTYTIGDFTKETWQSRLSPHSLLRKFLEVIKHFKAKYNTKIIVGGTLAVAFSDFLEHDHVLQLDAENTLPQLLDKIKRNGIQKKPYDWAITSCDFKWHDTDCISQREPLPLETARGCIFECKFCQYELIGKKKGTYERPLEHVEAFIRENYERYGTTHYWFVDDTSNDGNERMIRFCEMVESLPFRINFSGFVRLDLFHRFPDTARRLYEAGLVGATFGIETFHPEASKVIGKAFNGKYGKDFLDHFYYDICDENIVINCGNIIGLPGESEAHIQQTLHWYSLRPHIQNRWSPLWINDLKRYPGEQNTSVFERNAESYGYEFVEGKPRNWWKRGEWNFDKAAELRRKITVRMKQHNVNAGDPWIAMHFLSHLQITPKQARQYGWRKIYQENLKHINQRNQVYFDQLKKL